MNSKQENPRRQFLKNISLAALSVPLLPNLLDAETPTTKAQSEAMACDKTTLDYYGQGPFYIPNAPLLQNNQLATSTEPGTRLIISGRVQNLDCTQVIPNTLLDIWQADDAGAYDNSGFNLRGKTSSNSQGFYVFETIKPGKYLNGSSYRPAHIHFKITTPGFNPLTTQLYFAGDPEIANDAAASIVSGQYDARARIIALTLNANGAYEGTWDIVLDGNGIPMGINDIHLDKGMIYSASPNPFYDELQIKYGVFAKARVSLLVYDISGSLVARLSEKDLVPEKYTAIWKPEPGLPEGHYFIALKINDLQVHYLKVIRSN